MKVCARTSEGRLRGMALSGEVHELMIARLEEKTRWRGAVTGCGRFGEDGSGGRVVVRWRADVVGGEGCPGRGELVLFGGTHQEMWNGAKGDHTLAA